MDLLEKLQTLRNDASELYSVEQSRDVIAALLDALIAAEAERLRGVEADTTGSA